VAGLPARHARDRRGQPYGAVVHASTAGDLRLAVEITWGGHQALRAEYAMVFAGRRASDGKPVFTTTPARASAVARCHARQRNPPSPGSPCAPAGRP
jgi:hypothetical protein